MKKNYSTLKKLVPLFFLLFSFAAFSQTIIRSQSFDSGASGYSDDLGYTVSSSTFVTVTNTTFESSPNSLRFSNNNGDDNRDSNVVFDNVDISAFSNVSVTVSFKAINVDNNEDLYLDISYDGGVNYSNSIQLVDGDNKNPSIDWGSPDGDNESVSSNPYTFFVPAGNNQIKIRIRATNLDNGEFFYVDNVVIKNDKYCRSSGNTEYVTGIRLVDFNTINNATPVEFNDYSDFTGISTTVTQGTSYDLTVNLNTSGNFSILAMAWIDWNQDGDFLDVGEAFILGNTNDNPNGETSNSPLSILIPTTALAGNTRMRISAKWNVNPTSCETGFDGEVEDYTINILERKTITTGTISPTSYCSGAAVSIPYTTTGTFNAGNVFTAQLSDTTGNFGSPVTIGTLSSTAAGSILGIMPAGTAAGTGYRIRVVSSNPAVTGSTNVVGLTVNTISTAPTSIIGTTTICSGSTTTLTASGGTLGTGGSFEWGTGSTVGSNIISGATSVSYTTLGLTSNTTYWVRRKDIAPCNTVTGGISQLVTVKTISTAPTSITGVTTICRGSTATLTASGGTLGTGGTYEWGTGSTVGSNIISGANSVSYTTLGLTSNTTYWVRRKDSAPCNTVTGGITQLVTVNTTAAPIASLQTFCSGATVANLVATGTAPQWYTTSTGGTALVSTTALATGTYFVSQTLNSCESTRTSVTVTVNTTAAPAASAQTFCIGSTVANLVASGTALKWYSVATGGTASLTTTALTTGTYYVSQTLNTCESMRTSVAVTVNTTSAPTLGTRTQPTCSTATGSAVLNGLPLGSWELTRSPGNVITTGSGTTTTISGLSSGTYTYSVISESKGLKGEYFNNKDLSGPPVLTRIDPNINFDWGNDKPHPSVNSDNFSVRWSGQVKPLYSEEYTFTTTSDDGVRLYLNGKLIIDNWTIHPPTLDSYKIVLTAGLKYDIVLEYFENEIGAVSKLSWTSTSQTPEAIQNSQLYSEVGCSSPASVDVVINAQPVTPVPPTLGAITHPTCIVPTGSIPLSGLPSSGSWTIIASPAAGLTGLTGTGETTIVRGLVAGTSYTFAVSNVTCTSPVSSNILIKSLPLVAKYNGSWTNGPPTIEQSIIFEGDYTSIGNLEGCDCTVNNGAKVVFKNINPTLGHTLTVTNDVKVLGSGKLTFENNASLVQTANSTTNTNSGKITYQRQTSPYKPFDYIYWSSPVVGQILRDVSPLTPLDKFYSFDVATYDWKQENPNLPMTNGVGYIIRGADYVLPTPTGTHQASFFGIPNNGLITVPIPSTAVNSESSALLGNPYPSALDANEFLKGNTSILEGTLYFWTHNTAIQNVGNITNGSQGSGALAYTSDDYATYNLTGGVTVVSAGNIVAGTAQTGNKPSGKIASGQSFFAGINSVAGTVKFENSMRVGVGNLTGNNTQFFRTASGKSDVTTVHENHRVWLNLTNTQGAFKQLLVGYITGATNAYDPFFDGVSFNGNEFVDFYSITDDETLTIQGRALPFDENDFVVLGYSSAIEGDFSISIDEVDGLLIGQNIYLEDKLNNTIHNLTKEAYPFETAIGTFDDRFVLRYTDKTLGVADLDQLEDQVIISKDKNELKIKSATETIQRVTIFDLLGKKVFDKEALDETEFRSSNVSLFKQMGIVKVTLATGQVISKKVAF
jgi:hypothetical protein